MLNIQYFFNVDNRDPDGCVVDGEQFNHRVDKRASKPSANVIVMKLNCILRIRRLGPVNLHTIHLHNIHLHNIPLHNIHHHGTGRSDNHDITVPAPSPFTTPRPFEPLGEIHLVAADWNALLRPNH